MRFGIAASAAALALAPAPATAQESTAPVGNAPAETIGPSELEDFSLNGTVTRPAPAAPARTAPGPTARPAPTRAPEPAATRAPAPGPAARQPAPRAPSVADAFPPADPLASAPTPAPAPAPADVGSLEPRPGFSPDPAPLGNGSGDQGKGFLPWLLALLLLGAGAGFYVWRRRSPTRYATAGGLSDALLPAEPAPAPAPVPVPPLERAPPPRPAAPSRPAGIVSSRLRPWLEIEFAPGRCVVEDDKATIQFDVVVFNSGSAPARDVLVEASMFNAGPSQDQEIQAFFEHPVAKGDRIPTIPPLKRVALNSTVSLARDQLREFEVAGRQLFVPLVGFNALYRWSGGEGQTSASYLVGRDTDGEKMAPLRLDLGPRIFRGLGAREHGVRLRK